MKSTRKHTCVAQCTAESAPCGRDAPPPPPPPPLPLEPLRLVQCTEAGRIGLRGTSSKRMHVCAVPILDVFDVALSRAQEKLLILLALKHRRRVVAVSIRRHLGKLRFCRAMGEGASRAAEKVVRKNLG